MSLHIITLGKAGLATAVWDVIVQIAFLRKGAAVTPWLRMRSHRMRDLGFYLDH